MNCAPRGRKEALIPRHSLNFTASVVGPPSNEDATPALIVVADHALPSKSRLSRIERFPKPYDVIRSHPSFPRWEPAC